jgi:putative ABC transport system permease protein
MAIRTLWRRVAMRLRRGRVASDLDEEMRLHVERREAALRRQGATARAARHRARRRFGNPLTLREEALDAAGWRWLDEIAQDVRFGARLLRRHPGFTATAVVTLALATGATTAIFSIVNGVLLRPLPLPDPDRLVQIYGRSWNDLPGQPMADPIAGPVGARELDAYASQSASFDGFSGYSLTTRHLYGSGDPARLTAVRSDFALFTVLGAQPMAGRTFHAGDPADVAVISAALWRSAFAADPSLPGRTVTLDGQPTTILGIMPDTFQFPYGAASMLTTALPEGRTDVWVPAPPGPQGRGRVSVIARMKPGVSIDAATAELRVIAARVQAASPPTVTIGVRTRALSDVVLGSVRGSLWLLFASVGLVLAAACANVANLLLARTATRLREVVTRAALGAGPVRLVRQFLAESLLLALMGGAAGALVARWSLGFLVTASARRIPRAHEVALDWRAFAFLLAACGATAVVFGLAPALSAARVDAHAITKTAGLSTPGRGFGRLRGGLVVVEVALAFVLACAAVAVIGEIARLQQVPSGMITEHVRSLHVTPRAPAAEYYAIEQRVSRLPGVVAAGFTQLVPLQNWGWEADFTIRGRPREGRPIAALRYVTPGYFRALGISLVRGRPFTDQDSPDSAHVVIVNEALVRKYLHDEDPIGRELDRGTIVGVIHDVRQAGLDREVEPEIYYPAAQNVTMASDIGMSLLVRTAGPPPADLSTLFERLTGTTPRDPLIDLVRAAIRDVDPSLATFNIRDMDQIVADSLWELRLYRWLIGLFAALALVLSAIGLSGVITCAVASRTREFAVRLALGCERAGLAGLVLRQGVRLTAAGLGAGAVLLGGLLIAAGSLPGAMRPHAPHLAVTAAVLVGIAMLACALPALRVARLDAATALRHDG